MYNLRKPETVLWRQVRAAIEEEIRSGRRQPGDRVETESALANRFGVNRHTVRRAMVALQHDGLVITEQGRGSFVAEPMVDYRLGNRTRFRNIVEGQSLKPSRVLLGISHKPADASIAHALEIEKGSPVVEIESIGYASGRPTGIGIHYFDETRFPGIAESYRETHSVTLALERFGITDYFRRESTVTAIMPTPRDCKLLDQSATRPLLFVEGINVDRFDNPIEYTISRMPTARMRILVSQDQVAEEAMTSRQ